MKEQAKQDQVIKALAALAQATRLQAFRALVVAGPAGMTPTDLAYHLDVPAPTLSFHLKELMAAGLVTQERDGRHLIYRADFSEMDALMSFLTAHCCQGEPCAATKGRRAKC